MSQAASDSSYGADPGAGWRRATEAIAVERDRLAILVETFDALSASLNVDRCTEVTARLAARHLADAAVVIAWAADGALTVTSGRRDGATARCTLGTDGADILGVPGVQEALQGYPPPPSRRVDPARLPAWLLPTELLGVLGSAAVIALPGHGTPAGALLLLRRAGAAASADADQTLLGPFAARAGAALAAARMYAEQVKITTALTADLLPPQLPDLDGVEFAGGYRASNDSERVSGDFYDVHLGSDTGDEPFVVLGDVCGKGLDAAVLTGKIRNTLHALLPVATDHHRLLDLLNRTLVDSHHSQFATLVLGTVSRSGGRVRLRLTCAGHPAPLIVRVDGRVEEADTHGSLIGVLPTVHATTATVELLPGETCLLYTDGLIEARGGPRGGDMFGEQRLRSTLAECAGLTAGAIVDHIQVLVSDWVGNGSRDDMAAIAITAPTSAGPGADGGTRAP
ncbi:MAG: PP2C family protein-serine/threonine phosphatase [bacterium]